MHLQISLICMMRLNLTGYKTDQTSESENAMTSIFILIILLLKLKKEVADFEVLSTTTSLKVHK